MGGAFSTVVLGAFLCSTVRPLLKASTVISRSCRSEGVQDGRDRKLIPATIPATIFPYILTTYISCPGWPG